MTQQTLHRAPGRPVGSKTGGSRRLARRPSPPNDPIVAGMIVYDFVRDWADRLAMALAVTGGRRMSEVAIGAADRFAHLAFKLPMPGRRLSRDDFEACERDLSVGFCWMRYAESRSEACVKTRQPIFALAVIECYEHWLASLDDDFPWLRELIATRRRALCLTPTAHICILAAGPDTPREKPWLRAVLFDPARKPAATA